MVTLVTIDIKHKSYKGVIVGYKKGNKAYTVIKEVFRKTCNKTKTDANNIIVA